MLCTLLGVLQLIQWYTSICPNSLRAQVSAVCGPGRTSTIFDTFLDVAVCRWHENFHLVMSLGATFFGDRFYVSRKGGTGGDGWVHPKDVNSMALSGLSFRDTLVGTEWVFSVLLCTNRLREQSSLGSIGARVWARAYIQVRWEC